LNIIQNYGEFGFFGGKVYICASNFDIRARSSGVEHSDKIGGVVGSQVLKKVEIKKIRAPSSGVEHSDIIGGIVGSQVLKKN
jgi:hypothetical protein